MRSPFVPLTMLLVGACRLDAFDALSRGTEPVTATDAGPCVGDAELASCGECGALCVASAYASATCEDGRCLERSVALTDPVAGPLHGGAAGGSEFPVSQQCDGGDVLIGLRGLVGDAAYGLGVLCGRISLAGGLDASVVPTRRAAIVGGAVSPAPEPYELACPEGAVVTGVAGATWVFPGAPMSSVRQLSLTCARVLLDRQGALVLAQLPERLTVGGSDAADVERFDEPCGAERAVAGFSGRSGAYLDALAVHCGTVRVVAQEVAPVRPGDAGPVR